MKTENHPIYTHIHPLGRFCFAASLFAASALTQHEWVLVCLLLLLVCQVRLLSGAWLPIRRAFRLLLWLIIPVFLLHLFFTPGRLIWPGSGVPFSHEGLNQATWLALRLCTLFIAAMALSRSLNKQEWTYYILRLPFLGKRLIPFVQLASPMRQMVGDKIKQQCKQKHSLKTLPNGLAVLFADVWQGAETQADRVWDDWQEPMQTRVNLGYALGIVMGLSGLLVLLMTGQA